MSNRVRFSCSASPIETLSDANGNTHDIVASEIGTNVGGGGESLNINAYDGTASNQGFKDAIVNYKVAPHTSGGDRLSSTIPDFIYVENTGYKYSSATTLGAKTTDVVLVVLREQSLLVGEQGGYSNIDGEGKLQHYELAWLQPEQAMFLPLGVSNKGLTQFGSEANDLSYFNKATGNSNAQLYVKTVQPDGSLAKSGNAIKFLCVT